MTIAFFTIFYTSYIRDCEQKVRIRPMKLKMV